MQAPLSTASSASLSAAGSLASAASGLLFPMGDAGNQSSNTGTQFTASGSAAGLPGSAAASSGGGGGGSGAAAGWQRAGSNGLGSGKWGQEQRQHRASRASDAGSEGGMSDTGMSVMSGDTEFTYRSSGEKSHCIQVLTQEVL
jgi:hypothetical protein